MIERHGTHVCKNPECGAEFAWSVFLRREHINEKEAITVKARCVDCGMEQKWIQELRAE